MVLIGSGLSRACAAGRRIRDDPLLAPMIAIKEIEATMSTHIIRYETKPERSDENQTLVEAVFEQLNTEKPEGLHYATFRMDDGVSFVHVVSYDDDDADLLRPLAAF